MEFSDWITRKYIEWRGNAYGREGTVSEFAAYVGVSQELMSLWMKKGGSKPRNQETVSKLVDKFGLEAYDALGIEISDEERYLWEFRELLNVLTPEEREELKRLGYMMLDKTRQAEILARLKASN